MSGTQTFCGKCGSSVAAGSAFCSKCGAPVGVQSQAQPGAPPTRRLEVSEKHEKQEKQEKGEKGEKHEKGGTMGGAFVGGSVLIWLGITFYLHNIGYLASDVWWAYFILGIGVILIVDGLVEALQRHPGYIGLLIGGAVVAFIGLSSILSQWQNLWPIFIVLLGVAVMVGGLASRRRSPTP